MRQNPDDCVAPAAPTVDDEATAGCTGSTTTTCDDAASSVTVSASWTKAAGCCKMSVSENTDDIGDSAAGKLSASAGSPRLAVAAATVTLPLADALPTAAMLCRTRRCLERLCL